MPAVVQFRAPGWWTRLRQRKVAKLEQLIGGDAARLATVSNEWLNAMLIVLVGLAVPMSLLAQARGSSVVYSVVAGVAWILGLYAGALSIKLARRADRLASEYVSDVLGIRVRLRGGGTSAARWKRRIETERRRPRSS